MPQQLSTGNSVEADELRHEIERLTLAIRNHERHRRGQGHTPFAYDHALWRAIECGNH